jgi:predicted nuclease with TOPRIM domain|tara:strand:+ start:274 stop:447 length:174 start_codon:yes stop_codon:yes gene_type:complete
MTNHENSNSDLHGQLDKMEHELRSLEFNRPYDMEKIRELSRKVYELKTRLAESELAF